ncbi:hypothetical protein ABK040_015382 [Willaertia magna]
MSKRKVSRRSQKEKEIIEISSEDEEASSNEEEEEEIITTNTKKKKTSTISFAKGFKLPTKKEIKKAIHSNEIYYNFEMTRRNSLQNELFYKPIPKPTSQDDWLAQYNEERQSFEEWKELRTLVCQENENLIDNDSSDNDNLKVTGDISLILIELEDSNVNSEKVDYLKHLLRYVKSFYFGFNGNILEKITIKKDLNNNYYFTINNKKFIINSRIAHPYDLHKIKNKNTTLQFKAGDILKGLNYFWKDKKKLNNTCLCAVTMEDLFIGKTDSFSCGLAQGGDHIGIFSFFRYKPLINIYYNKYNKNNNTINNDKEEMIQIEWKEDTGKKSDENKELILVDREEMTRNDFITMERGCKILCHEIGHMFQIGHCIYFDCIMNGSGHLEEDYRQSIHLCPVDLRKLQTVTGCNILERYRSLLHFYKCYGMKEEESWIEDMIEYLDENL